jgi:Flp pilus assembly pilin Flp
MSKRQSATLRQNFAAVRRLHDAENGATAIEYVLIAYSIALAFVAITFCWAKMLAACSPVWLRLCRTQQEVGVTEALRP